MKRLVKNSIISALVFLFVFSLALVSSAAETENTEAYTITYELNKGENSALNPLEYTEGQVIEFAAPTRENHTFAGWYLEKSFENKIVRTTEATKGNITLYAKWHLEGINRGGEGTEDMIWSWWYYPQVVSTDTDVFFGYSTSEGYCGVAKYNFEAGKTEKTDLKRILPVDDHNGLAVTLMDDGRVLCAYAGGHNNNNEIHIRISEEAESIKNFSKHIVLESAGKTCYSQILRYKGQYYVFYRINNNSWGYRSSPDGENWSKETVLIKTSMQYYCRFMPTTQDGLFRICMYSNPREADPSIRMGFFNAENGELLNADAQTVVGTEKVSQEKFSVIIEREEGKRQRLFDVAVSEPSRPLVLYTVFTSDKKAEDSVYYLYDSGKTYKICDGGIPIMSNNYQCGASFAGDKQIVTVRNENSSDIVELYDYNGNEITLQNTVYKKETGENHHRNGRPIVDINGRVFLWHEGYYNPAKYTEFSTSARVSAEIFNQKSQDSVLHFNCDKEKRGFTLTEDKAVSCTEDGVKTYTCNCGAFYKEVTEKTGHNEVILPAVSATYAADGWTEGKKCTVCGEITVPQKKIARKKLSKVKSLKVKAVTTTSVTLSFKKVTGAERYKVYYSQNGKKWKSVTVTKTTATVKILKSGTAYSFKVKAFAEKSYGEISSAVKTATKVKKVTLSLVESAKKGQATVNWKTVTGANGYALEYSTSKKFTDGTTKTVKLKKSKTKKYTLKKLESGKTYYVRVKAYKTVNGKTVYGAKSSVKSVKIK